MKRCLSVVLVVGSLMSLGVLLAQDKKQAKSAAELEKEKALKNPYANDLGPAEINLTGYPESLKEGYKFLAAKCSKCHPSSRPINSEFVEPEGKNPAERKTSLEKLKKENPDVFKEKNVWKVDANMWERYVKRMMAKPGCEISRAEGKKIWEFLVYDSSRRKLGKNKEAWAKQRRGLLTQFKEKHPARYKELYGAEEKAQEGKKEEKKQGKGN